MKRVNLTDENGVRIASWFNAETAEYFKEDTYFNGRNWISRATGDQFYHQGLYITSKKRFILNSWSNWQGSKETYEIISKEDAVEWLIRNGYYEEVETAYADILEKYEV
jgi:hypothetical protein